MENDHTETLKVVTPVLNSMELEEIKKVVMSSYPEIGKPEKKIGDGSRPYSASSLFSSSSGEYFLKKRNIGWRDREDIEWKHSIIEHLGKSNFPTPSLVMNNQGSTLTQTEEFYYELFHRASGVDLYQDYHSWMTFKRSDHAVSSGETMARFHLALEDFDISGRPQVGTVVEKPMTARFDMAFHRDLSKIISERIQNNSEVSEFFKDKNWQTDLLPLLTLFQKDIPDYKEIIKPWVSHGDWHANNLFFDCDKVSAVIDFHLTDLSFRLYDLAVALDRNCIQWLEFHDGKIDVVRFDLIGLFIEGYNSVFPVSGPELKLLSLLMPIHQLDLAISNIEYYLCFEKNEARAEWAYQVYLIEHLKFYQLPGGKEVVKFIENYYFMN